MDIHADKLVSLEFLPEGFRDTLGRRLPMVLMFVLVVVLAYQLSGLTWRVVESFFTETQPIQATAPANSIAKSGRKSRQRDYAQLANLHLFGKLDETKVVERAPATAPETRLALILYGVFTDEDSKKGSAIIGPKSGKQEFYYAGDKVSTGVWLSEVRKDHVLLKRGASYEVLKFPKQSSAGINIKNTAQTTPKLPLNQTKQSFMENVKIIPVFSGPNKTLKGYRILPKKNRAVYNRLGLKPSDIVTAINGIALSDQREAMKVIGELVKSDQVEVQLDRNGQVETKVLNLK